MNPFMLFQVALLGKCLLTFITWKRAFTAMNPFMLFQTARADKCTLTYITWKRAFTGMNPFMLFQVILLGKCLLTYITWKRAFTGMTPFMLCQSVRADTFILTCITFKRAFGVMSFCMTHKITLHIEVGITHLIFIRESDAINCFELLRLRQPGLGLSGYFITGIVLAVFSVKVIRRAGCSQCC